VTLHPARAAGLFDRGEIAAGLRADLARIRVAQAYKSRGLWALAHARRAKCFEQPLSARVIHRRG
jgi:cytosine/adenosine deaminase-related metal-dependent hydrolase